MKHLWIILFFLASCGPTAISDLRLEGEFQTQKLAEELREIENKEELQGAVPRLKKRFVKIADLLIAARQFPDLGAEPSAASEQLFAELARLYELPGGKELIESAQSEAIAHLRR
jgi:hypothetical protein